MTKFKCSIQNLDCANCANKIEKTLQKNDKLKNVNVNFSTLKLTYESDIDCFDEVKEIVNDIEPEVILTKVGGGEQSNEKKSCFPVLRLCLGIILAGISLFPLGIISTILLLTAYVLLLYRTFKNALKLLLKQHTINENFLITISCIGAYLVGEHMEGFMVIVLYEIGKILEEKAICKSRKSISSLMDMRPEYANVKKGKELVRISPEEVKINDIIVIKNGEKMPVDGVVMKGTTHLDMKALTGETVPYLVEKGSNVLSGSINLGEVIEVKVTKLYEDSTVNRILDLVENATDKKAKTENFVSKAARIYTPIVLGLAILTAVILPIISTVSYAESVYRALIFLVISCPCAIAISVPLSYFSCIGSCSKQGILIKGSNYIDVLRQVEEVVFDKTGTLTTGNFKMDKVESYSDYTEEDVLMFAIRGEYYSNHPIAKSIVGQTSSLPSIEEVENAQEIAGVGVKYEFHNHKYEIGNFANSTRANTISIVEDGKLIGAIIMQDEIKDSARKVIPLLHDFGIKTTMFTGDKKASAQAVGHELQLKEVQYEMLPQDKYKALESKINIAKKHKKYVAFVGDGINDAPVLTLADIGVSMGGVGSSSAIEASDIVIMNDDLTKIVKVYTLSVKTSRIIKQNLMFAIGTKITILLLSVLGFAGMWEAIFADVGVTLLTILNSLRILRNITH